MKISNILSASLAFALTASVFAAPAFAAGGPEWPFPETPKNPQPPPAPVDLGTCKIITDGLIVIPGSSADPKNTSHFGQTAKLQSVLTPAGLILRVELTGTNSMGKPNIQTLDLDLASSIGGDYMSFGYYTKSTTDEIRWIRAELEFTERNAKDQVTKALLSTLVQQKAPDSRTGKMIDRSYTARYFCDVIPQ